MGLVEFGHHLVEVVSASVRGLPESFLGLISLIVEEGLELCLQCIGLLCETGIREGVTVPGRVGDIQGLRGQGLSINRALNNRATRPGLG